MEVRNATRGNAIKPSGAARKKATRKAAPKKPPVVGKVIKRGANGNRAYVLRYDSEWQDNIVQFFVGGVYQTKADGHFYEDRQDAIDTAENWLAAGTRENPAKGSRHHMAQGFVKFRFSSANGATAGLVMDAAEFRTSTAAALSRMFPYSEAGRMARLESSPVYPSFDDAFAHEFTKGKARRNPASNLTNKGTRDIYAVMMEKKNGEWIRIAEHALKTDAIADAKHFYKLHPTLTVCVSKVASTR